MQNSTDNIGNNLAYTQGVKVKLSVKGNVSITFPYLGIESECYSTVTFVSVVWFIIN